MFCVNIKMSQTSQFSNWHQPSWLLMPPKSSYLLCWASFYVSCFPWNSVSQCSFSICPLDSHSWLLQHPLLLHLTPWFSSFHFGPNLFSSCHFLPSYITFLEVKKWCKNCLLNMNEAVINHCAVQSREMNWFGEIKYWYYALRASTKLGNFENFAWSSERQCEKILKYK